MYTIVVYTLVVDVTGFVCALVVVVATGIRVVAEVRLVVVDVRRVVVDVRRVVVDVRLVVVEVRRVVVRVDIRGVVVVVRTSERCVVNTSD